MKTRFDADTRMVTDGSDHRLEHILEMFSGVGALVHYVLDVNRHHFLAGRRAFALWKKSDEEWSFETAAVERFSRPEYRFAITQIAGGDEAAVVPIWMRMCENVRAQFGIAAASEKPEAVHEIYSYSDFRSHALYADVIATFPNLVSGADV